MLERVVEDRMDRELKNKDHDEASLGRKSLNFAIWGFGLILIVLLVGAVVVMGSLLKQFVDGRGIGNKNIPADYKLGMLMIRESPEATNTIQSGVNDSTIQDISRTVLLASVKIRSYTQGTIPLADVTCFGIMMEESGYIITSTVVVRDESILEVELYDGSRHQAKMVGYDLKTDLCILKIDGKNLRTASFGSGGMKAGDGCIYIGLGQREIVNISQGLIGETEGRYLNTEIGHSYIYLTATDRIASDICYGGVVVNYLGQIVGFRNSKADDSHNMVYAFSVEDARVIIDNIINNGYVKDRYTLGFSVDVVSDVIAMQNRFPTGLIIIDMDYDVFSGDRRVSIGDIIVSVNGEKVTTATEYEDAVTGITETVLLELYHSASNEYYEIELSMIEDTGLYLH